MIKAVIVDNFKAFANPTTITFSPGTTGVIGPNGSGKSNITDAIKWVMGEQSSKNLRGEKMEDVIFNGTTKRKQGDYAEVTLVLDNINGYFPEIHGKEVKVTRTVIRDKGSQYSINDNPCRLKDLQKLFMDSGIGSRSYSMISQNDRDRILSTNKDDRRSIFEEAAGITMLKQQKRKTEEKLSEVEQNLLRYSDILDVMEKQLNPLKKQSEKAEKYKIIHEELTTLEVQYLVQEYDVQKSILQEISKQLMTEKENLQTYIDDLESLEVKLQNLKQSQETYEQEVFSVQDELVKAKEMLEKENSTLLVIEEKIQHTNEKLTNILHSLKEFEDKFSFSADDYANRQQYLSDLRTNIENMNGESSELVDTISELEIELSALRTSQEITKDDSINTYNELNQRKEKNEQLQKERIRLQDEIKELEDKCFQNENNLQDLDFQLDQKVKEKETALATIQQNKDMIVQMESKGQELSQTKSTLDKTSVRLQEEKIKVKSETEYLTQLIENNDGFYEGVKFILNESKNGNIKGVHGAIASLVKMDETHESAVEQLLQGSLQFIVTDDEQIAKHAVELLKQNKKGRATFRPLTLAKESSFRSEELKAIESTTGIQKAIDVVEFDSIYQPVIHSLLGRSLIANNLDIAINFSKKYSFPIKIATLDGDIVDASSISGGYNKSKNNSILSKKRSLEKAKSRLEKLVNEIDETKTELEIVNNQLNELTKEKQSLQDACLSLEYSIKDCENESIYIAKEKDRMTESIDSINLEIDEIKANLLTYSDDSETLRDQIQQLERKNNQLQTELNSLLKNIQEKEKSLSESNEKKMTLLVETSRLSEEIRQLENSLEVFNSNNSEAMQKFELLASQKIDLETSLNELDSEKEMVQSNIDEYAKKTSELEDVSSSKKQSNSDFKSSIKETEKTISSIRSEKEKFDKLVHESEMKQEKTQGIINGTLNRLSEGYEIEEEIIGEFKRVKIDRDESQAKVKQLKSQLSALGSINHNAIEEYIELKTNFDEQNKQYVDMKEAKKDLTNMLNEVYAEMLDRFNASFKEITVAFSQLFKSFFGGGKGEIYLIDKKNPLESPIEIEAAPPGKKPTSINSLSGGERSLAAVALIFSILQTKPSPFVILDEIDAPLDDANIIRFTDHLKEFAKSTQFIVITHRTQTMKVLEYLYGVSQAEKGVSLVVPCSLEDIEAAH